MLREQRIPTCGAGPGRNEAQDPPPETRAPRQHCHKRCTPLQSLGIYLMHLDSEFFIYMCGCCVNLMASHILGYVFLRLGEQSDGGARHKTRYLNP